MAKSKLVKANEKIAEEVVSGYKAVEGGVVGGYKKIEETVVGGYHKIEDAFVDRYLTHEGESVEEAKARLHAEQEERQAQGQNSSTAALSTDYVHEAQEHTMEHVRRAQEKAHVSGSQPGANEERESFEHEKE